MATARKKSFLRDTLLQRANTPYPGSIFLIAAMTASLVTIAYMASPLSWVDHTYQLADVVAYSLLAAVVSLFISWKIPRRLFFASTLCYLVVESLRTPSSNAEALYLYQYGFVVFILSYLMASRLVAGRPMTFWEMARKETVETLKNLGFDESRKAIKEALKDEMPIALAGISPVSIGSGVVGEQVAAPLKKVLMNIRPRLIGQEKAIEQVCEAFRVHDRSEGKPLSLLFCGASGVGKTQLAENLARALGTELVQFNMGELGGGQSTHGSSIAKDALLGLPPGYVESEKGGRLTNALGRAPDGIFLFDEMEKAPSDAYDIFLNMLDKGWIKDARGRRYDCSRAIMVFTTNVARDTDPDLPEDKIRDKMVRAGFRPELMGRIAKAIIFRPLTLDLAKEILDESFGKELRKVFASAGVKELPKVVWQPEDVSKEFYLESIGFDSYGVRAIQKAAKSLAGEVCGVSDQGAKERIIIYPATYPVPDTDEKTAAVSVGKKIEYDLEGLRRHVLDHVKGQDHALDCVIEQLEMRQLGLVAKKNQPEGTFLFTGPSGTGKTEMVKRVAEFMGRKFLFFNMGNYKDESGVQSFFGPPPGYQGSDKGGQLTQAVLDYPDAIILLDEVEKAHPKIWDSFMSVFDDGVAKDTSTGEMVPFDRTMIFMTSNLIVSGTEHLSEQELRDRIRDTGYLRPEMLNRIENVVAFRGLSDSESEAIVRKLIQQILDNYNRRNGRNVQLREEWVQRFAAGADFTHGVRDVQRRIQRELMRELKG